MIELPPTPSKFHYIFNLRDLSRIYSGLCLTTPDMFDKTDQFIRVWRNECMRVIFDRLISDTDKEIVQVSVGSASLFSVCALRCVCVFKDVFIYVFKDVFMCSTMRSMICSCALRCVQRCVRVL